MMKKGLAMLVAAMVISLICVVGSAAATTEAAVGTMVAETIGVAFFIGIGVITIGAAVYIRWSEKKSPDRIVRRSIKALNAAVLVGMVAVNAKHTRVMHTTGVATSPEMISRTYGIYLDTR